jgi:Cdc6-like AAA superfamily ATPase
MERRAFDYTDLERAMALADQAIGRARRALDALAGTVRAGAEEHAELWG